MSQPMTEVLNDEMLTATQEREFRQMMAKRPVSNPVYCPEDGCDGRIVLARPSLGVPLLPMCTQCATVVAPARERMVLRGWVDGIAALQVHP